MGRLLSLHLCLVVFASFSKTESFDQDILQVIDAMIENDFLPFSNLTGLGLGIVKLNGSGEPAILSKGYGMRDLEKQIKVDNQTLFAIGSITKSFTATIIVKTLTEKYPAMGEGVLDVPISTLVPSLNFTLGDRYRSESVSFRDLLSHRTCISPGGLGFIFRAYKNAEELSYRFRYSEESCPFRTNFVYNNIAYVMAGEIIAQIANSTIEDMLTNFLMELGMNSTLLIHESDDYETILNMSKSYYSINGEAKRFNSDLLKWIALSASPGGILSTSDDMLRYIQFHLNNGKVGDKQIVPETAIKYLRKSSIAYPALVGKTQQDDVTLSFPAYGLGFLVGLTDGWETIAHDGALPPYTSYMSIYPALNLGIYTVGNGPNAAPSQYIPIHKLIYQIIERGQRNTTGARKTPTQPVATPQVNTKFCDIQEIKTGNFVGTYGNGVEGEFVISETNGSLYINYGVLGTGNLEPVSETRFFINWDSDIDQIFILLGWKNQTLDFSVENVTSLIISFTSTEVQLPVIYKKDLTLDKLPATPWEPDTCGPVKKS